jgi:hypothetical protein
MTMTNKVESKSGVFVLLRMKQLYSLLEQDVKTFFSINDVELYVESL